MKAHRTGHEHAALDFRGSTIRAVKIGHFAPAGLWDPSWRITGAGFAIEVQDPAYDLHL